MAQIKIDSKTCPIRLALALRKCIYSQKSDYKKLVGKRLPSLCRELFLKCPPCQDEKGRAPISCKNIVASFIKIQAMERGESHNTIRELKQINKNAAAKSHWILHFESAVALAKAYRTFQFNLFAALAIVDEALQTLDKIAICSEFKSQEGRQYLREIEWSLKNQKCWALLFLRRPREAMQCAQSCPGLDRKGIEPHIFRLQKALGAFIQAWDLDRNYEKALKLFS